MKNIAYQETNNDKVIEELTEKEKQILSAENDADIKELMTEREEFENLMKKFNKMEGDYPSAIQKELFESEQVHEMILDVLFLIKRKLQD